MLLTAPLETRGVVLGKHQHCQEAGRSKGKAQATAFLGVSVGKARQGKQAD